MIHHLKSILCLANVYNDFVHVRNLNEVTIKQPSSTIVNSYISTSLPSDKFVMPINVYSESFELNQKGCIKLPGCTIEY